MSEKYVIALTTYGTHTKIRQANLIFHGFARPFVGKMRPSEVGRRSCPNTGSLLLFVKVLFCVCSALVERPQPDRHISLVKP